MAITLWKDKAERARAALARFKKHTTSNMVNARHDAEAVIAGGIAGAIRGSFEASGKDYSLPGPNGSKVPPELLIGGLLLAIGFSGQADEATRDFHSAGSGVLAYSAGREAENYMRLKGTKPAGAVQ
jgi:hypothetical protein